MFISIAHNKQYNKKYVYIVIKVYDKSTKVEFSNKITIGLQDPKTGRLIMTKGTMKSNSTFNKLLNLTKLSVEDLSAQVRELLIRKGLLSKKDIFDLQKTLVRQESKITSECNEIANISYGATQLLDKIGERTGITGYLKQCFPDVYLMILSIVYYFLLSDNSPLSGFKDWNNLFYHPYRKNIPSQRSSELFMGITQQDINKFFKLLNSNHNEKEYLFYDGTTISSYSKNLPIVQYGRNKENIRLQQFNIVLVVGEKSGLPRFYRIIPGNISDVMTIHNLIYNLEELTIEKIKLILDAGFFSAENINLLLKGGHAFIISGLLLTNCGKKTLEENYKTVTSYKNFNDIYKVHSMTVPIKWKFNSRKTKKEDRLKEEYDVYAHIYFDRRRRETAIDSFEEKLIKALTNLRNGIKVDDMKFFNKIELPEGKIKYEINNEVVEKETKYYGYSILLSNEELDAIKVLELYRSKDHIEKTFHCLKSEIDFDRADVSSEESLRGKAFVKMISLFYTCYIKKQMEESDMFRKYTLTSMLNKLKLIKCSQFPEKEMLTTEILNEQKEIFKFLGF